MSYCIQQPHGPHDAADGRSFYYATYCRELQSISLYTTLFVSPVDTRPGDARARHVVLPMRGAASAQFYAGGAERMSL